MNENLREESEKMSHSEQPRREQHDHRLYRSRANRIIAGVCGGLGELTGIDANLIRLAWLLLFFFGGTGIIIYLIMTIVVPERPQEGETIGVSYANHWQNAGRNGALVIGIIIIVFGMALLLNSLGWLPVSLGYLWHLFWRLSWPLLLIGIGLLVLLSAFWGDRGWWRDIRMPAQGVVLRRSRSNRMVDGVCGGLAEYFNIDPSLIRIIWAIGTLSTMGMGILAYIIAAIVLPEE